MKLYSIRDIVAQEYMPPFPGRNDGTALRTMGVTLSKDPYAQEHLGEFELWELCEWDRDTGMVTCDKTHPRLVMLNLNMEMPENAT